MRNVLRRLAIIDLIAVAAASVSACSGVSGVVADTGTPPQNRQTPYVVTRWHSETLTGGPNLPIPEASQQCDANEDAVGGGYSDDAYQTPIESRPTANGWVVGFLPQPPAYGPYTFGVAVFAQCLVGGTAGRVSVQSVSQDFLYPSLTRAAVVAQCPADTTAVGGGYAMADDSNYDIVMDGSQHALGGGTFRSRATHDVSAGATAFVICYSSPVSVSVIRDHATQLSPYIARGGDDAGHYIGYQEARYDNTCRAGASTTTGGYTSPTSTVNFAFFDAPDLNSGGWEIDLISENQPFPVGGELYAEFACVAF